MNNADLVWRLVELLLQKEKDLQQVALDQADKDYKPNVKKQDEAQLADKDDVALPLSYIVFFYKNEKIRCYRTSNFSYYLMNFLLLN